MTLTLYKKKMVYIKLIGLILYKILFIILSYSEGIKRLSMELPIPCQSYMDCPYFDLNLFSFDEKLILPTD